ncbi:MAG: reverse transcriptase/maturase family protein [Methylococcales bacterium]|nr:reverse transcriptase/maturase family protein [Methylococcales bacterium]
MQRNSIRLEQIADHENLLRATWKAARGKQHRPAVARFLDDLNGRLKHLADAILQEHAPLGRCRRFVIHDPKRREITAACFADRVLHHAIMNLAEPRFERMLVDSTFACRPGKGVHAAVEAVQNNLRRFPWLVQVDIQSYFPSIDHAILKKLLATRFKGAAFIRLLERIIASGEPSTSGCGLPIGSLTSQHFANAYLDSADRFLLNHSAVCAHIRYMDDIVWWCRSRQEATETLQLLRDFLWQSRKLTVKSTVQIRQSRQGLCFCGFRVRQGVVLPSSRKLSRYRAGLRRINTARAKADVSEQQAQRAYDNLLATLNGTQSLMALCES